MATRRPSEPGDEDWGSRPKPAVYQAVTVILLLILAMIAWMTYASFRVEVPAKSVAVFVKKTGLDLPNDMELAPDDSYKGVQLQLMKEGRAFFNPYAWEWSIHPQVEVPDGHLGVLIRLFGDELEHDDLLAHQENQKGIVPGALVPGRYPDFSNPFAYHIELHRPVIIPAGFKGVLTLVTGKMPAMPNQLLVQNGERGVQTTPLDPGAYYFNPYEKRVSLIDCRTKMLSLSEEQDMGFPSLDGFWIRLDGTVQFHVIPEEAPRVYVTYNEQPVASEFDDIYREIADKVILPNARSFCRLAGSSFTGKQFIEGGAREEFQNEFQQKMSDACKPLGIEIVSALITKIYPPELIADPVRRREIAKQEQKQYDQETQQQKSEAKLITEKMRIDQKKRLIEAEREVVQMKTKAQQEQKVAVTLAEQEMAVAERLLEAAQDQAAAIMSKGKAEADVVRLNNEAEASGFAAAVKAFDGNGYLYAQQVLLQKLAPAYKQIMANSTDSPMMKIFEKFHNAPSVAAPTSRATQAQRTTTTPKGATP